MNVRYLTGFTGTNGACIVTPEERLFFTDFRYVEQASEQVREYERIEAGRDMLGDLAGRLRGRAGFDDEHLSVAAHRKLSEKLPEGVELVPAGGLVEELRAREGRVRGGLDARGRGAVDRRLRVAPASAGWPGAPSATWPLQLVRFMEDSGAEGPSFPPIVAAGEHGALPHAVPRDVEIPRDTLVVIDMGAIGGRLLLRLHPHARHRLARRWRARDLRAGAARPGGGARRRARPGAACSDVDAVARGIIDAAGHEEHFGHGLGHGVGLQVHEAPRLGKTAKGELAAGNAVTVEPGVYVPGQVGVRIEDLVIVTDGEPEILTGFPKDLVTVG